MNTKASPAKVTSSCIESSTASPISPSETPPNSANTATARKPTIIASPMLRLRTAFQTMITPTKATRRPDGDHRRTPGQDRGAALRLVGLDRAPAQQARRGLGGRDDDDAVVVGDDRVTGADGDAADGDRHVDADPARSCTGRRGTARATTPGSRCARARRRRARPRR